MSAATKSCLISTISICDYAKVREHPQSRFPSYSPAVNMKLFDRHVLGMSPAARNLKFESGLVQTGRVDS